MQDKTLDFQFYSSLLLASDRVLKLLKSKKWKVSYPTFAKLDHFSPRPSTKTLIQMHVNRLKYHQNQLFYSKSKDLDLLNRVINFKFISVTFDVVA